MLLETKEIGLIETPAEELGSTVELLASLELPEQPVIKTAEIIAEELKQLKYQNYLINFKTQIDSWKANHPNHVPPPIQYDSEFGDYVWINREMRRR